MSPIQLPGWLSSPPILLTNLPFLPPSDLGQECRVGGREGVCTTSTKCQGRGRVQAGPCTRDKSVCCTGTTVLYLLLYCKITPCCNDSGVCKGRIIPPQSSDDCRKCFNCWVYSLDFSLLSYIFRSLLLQLLPTVKSVLPYKFFPTCPLLWGLARYSRQYLLCQVRLTSSLLSYYFGN